MQTGVRTCIFVTRASSTLDLWVKDFTKGILRLAVSLFVMCTFSKVTHTYLQWAWSRSLCKHMIADFHWFKIVFEWPPHNTPIRGAWHATSRTNFAVIAKIHFKHKQRTHRSKFRVLHSTILDSSHNIWTRDGRRDTVRAYRSRSHTEGSRHQHAPPLEDVIREISTRERPCHAPKIEKSRRVCCLGITVAMLLAEIEGQPEEHCVAGKLDEEVGHAKIE